MPPHHEGAFAERSRTQLGLVTLDQSVELGLSAGQRRTLLAHGAYRKILPKVIAAVAVAPSWHQSLTAGLLQLGPSALVSHAAAAALQELDGVRPGAVEFTVVRGERNRATVGRLHSSSSIDLADRATVDRFPVTSVPRTILDCASRFGATLLERVVDGACRDHRTSELELLATLERLPGRRGSRLLRTILAADAATGRPHSWLERRLVETLRDAGLPVPRLQVDVDAAGRVRRLDGCYEEHRLALEVSGHRTHSTRRQRQADAERRLQVEWQGYRVLEFTYEDVTERPEYVTGTIGRWLARGIDVTKSTSEQPKR